jgi:hypothetical protein
MGFLPAPRATPTRRPGGIALGTRDVFQNATHHGVADIREDDRNGPGPLQHCQCCGPIVLFLRSIFTGQSKKRSQADVDLFIRSKPYFEVRARCRVGREAPPLQLRPMPPARDASHRDSDDLLLVHITIGRLPGATPRTERFRCSWHNAASAPGLSPDDIPTPGRWERNGGHLAPAPAPGNAIERHGRAADTFRPSFVRLSGSG